MFKLNLKIALRNLWKNKSFSLINIGGLTIGMASCLLLLLYVSYEWGYDKQFTNYDKTYVVYTNFNESGGILTGDNAPTVMAAEIRDKVPGVSTVSRFTTPSDILISNGDKKFKGMGIFADPNFLKILDLKVIRLML